MFILLSVTLISVTVLVLVIWKVYSNAFRIHKHLEKIPGPPGLPVIGNAFDFGDSTEILDQFLNFCKKYGTLYKTELALRHFYLICTDVKFLEFLLTTPKILEKSFEYRYLHGWLGTGLLTSGGKKWKQRRKIITPTFHFQILEQFVEVFESAGKILISKLEKEVGKKEIDIYPFITLCALDIICESAMGTSVNAQINSDSEYVHSVKEMCRILMERTFSVIKMNDFTYKFTEDYRKEKKALKILHDYTDSVISKRRKEFKENKPVKMTDENFGIKRKMAFLDLLLQSTIDGKPLSDEDIREEVDTFMFEGHDTTAAATSFVIYCLAQNQDVQRKAVEELKDIFENNKNKPITYQDLQKMKYLEMVIKETMRLFPTVPMFGKYLDNDFEYNGMVLPKGLAITVFIYGIHKNPDLWPEPDKFDPERFSVENSIGRSHYAFIPFSAGPRNCIGQKFAMLEMKASVSRILRNFEIHPIEREHKLVIAAEIVLKSTTGIMVQLKKREKF